MRTKNETCWIIKWERSQRYLVDAPPTGFRSTTRIKKATRFSSEAELDAYRKERGVYGNSVRAILCHF